MKVEILTPEKVLFTGDAVSVYLPGSDGSLGILNRHAPMISSLKNGTLRIKDGAGKEHKFEVNGGTAEMFNNKVTILAE